MDPSTKISVGGALLVPMTYCKPHPCSEVEKMDTYVIREIATNTQKT